MSIVSGSGQYRKEKRKRGPHLRPVGRRGEVTRFISCSTSLYPRGRDRERKGKRKMPQSLEKKRRKGKTGLGAFLTNSWGGKKKGKEEGEA